MSSLFLYFLTLLSLESARKIEHIDLTFILAIFLARKPPFTCQRLPAVWGGNGLPNIQVNLERAGSLAVWGSGYEVFDERVREDPEPTVRFSPNIDRNGSADAQCIASST
jgi:hypothetical protein